MRLFDYKDYKKYVKERIQNMPKKGRGELKKLSEHLSVTSTIISQIFNGERDLTPEQAILVSEYFGHSELETRYFELMVRIERSGTAKYSKYLKQEAKALLKEAKKIDSRVPFLEEITEEYKVRYYSDWTYIATRLLCTIPETRDIDSISERLQMPRDRVRKILDFLLLAGLIKEDNGKFSYGDQFFHLDPESPLAVSHHRNWRGKAIEKLNNPNPEDMFYTLTVTVSKEDLAVIKEECRKSIQRILEVVKPSEAETMACLTFDWFEVK